MKCVCLILKHNHNLASARHSHLISYQITYFSLKDLKKHQNYYSRRDQFQKHWLAWDKRTRWNNITIKSYFLNIAPELRDSRIIISGQKLFYNILYNCYRWTNNIIIFIYKFGLHCTTEHIRYTSEYQLSQLPVHAITRRNTRFIDLSLVPLN